MPAPMDIPALLPRGDDQTVFSWGENQSSKLDPSIMSASRIRIKMGQRTPHPAISSRPDPILPEMIGKSVEDRMNVEISDDGAGN